MTTGIIISIIAVLIGGGVLFMFTSPGKHLSNKLTGGKDDALTDLQASNELSSAEDLGATKQGAPRDPHAIVLGYYVDAKNASRVRRNPSSGQLVSTEPYLPTLVLGPPGSGKTSALLANSILCWSDGTAPVLAGSVKHDLVDTTIKLRSKLGTAQIFDPSGNTPAHLRKYLAKWTPLTAARTWKGAVEIAEAMVFAGEDDAAGDSFWAGQSSSLLAVIMFVTASKPSTSMMDVSKVLGELLEPEAEGDDKDTKKGFPYLHQQIVEAISRRKTSLEKVQEDANNGTLSTADATRQITSQERRIDEFQAALESLLPFLAVAKAAPQTIGGILASCSGVLRVYRFAREYARVKWDAPDLIDVDHLLSGPNTVYLIAPPRNQSLYAPLLSAFQAQTVSRAYEVAQANTDGALKKPLLVCIDEVAAMPIADLPTILATARSFKICMLIATQDASQLYEKYSENLTNSIVSSCASLVALPRIKDPVSLRLISGAAGELRVQVESRTVSESESKSKSKDNKDKQTGKSESVTYSEETRQLLPPGRVASFAPLEGFAIVGSYRTQLLLRPFYSTPVLKRLADGDVSAMQDENSLVKTDIPERPTDRLVDLDAPLDPEIIPQAPARGRRSYS